MTILSTKVVIIGGGPAGATLSRFLSQSRIDNILLEKNLQNDKPCGGGLPSIAFDEFQIPASLIKNRIKSVRIVSPSGFEVDTPLLDGFLAIVQRKEFDKTLRGMAQESGSQVINGEFRDIIFENGKKVVIARTDDREIKVRSGYIVAADGVNSRVRKALMKSFPQRLFSIYKIIKNYKTDICEFWFGSFSTPDIYSWVFPHDQSVSIGMVIKKRCNFKVAKDYLEDFINKKGFSNVTKTKGYYIPIWDDYLYFKKGVYFVGDASGQALPFAYEGIYYAMKSAEFAATAIIENKPSLYKKLWRARFKKSFLLSKRLQTLSMKNDVTIEKLIAMYADSEIQRLSLRLWLKKEVWKGSFLSYLNLIKKYINVNA